MSVPAVSHGPADYAFLIFGLVVAYFGIWLECRAAIAERDSLLNDSPSHDDLARRQGEIDAATHTRLQ